MQRSLKVIYHHYKLPANVIGISLIGIIAVIGYEVSTKQKPTPKQLAQTVQTQGTDNTSDVSSVPASGAPLQSASTPNVTGFGATSDDWNSNHQVDNRYDSGAVYDATPGLGLDSQHDDKYYDVSSDGGTVTSYTMRLPNQSTLAAAQAEVMQEFPSDAKVFWQHTQDQCSQMEVLSATLSSVLGGSGIGDSQGQGFVEFQTDTSSTENLNSYYDSSNVNTATLTLGSYNTAADAPDC